jgi:hypothetical protein
VALNTKIDSGLVVHTGRMNEKWRNQFTQKIYQYLAQHNYSSEEGSKAYFCKHSKKPMLPYKLTMVLKNAPQIQKLYYLTFWLYLVTTEIYIHETVHEQTFGQYFSMRKKIQLK